MSPKAKPVKAIPKAKPTAKTRTIGKARPKAKATPVQTVIDERYSGVALVLKALQEVGLAVREDVATKFRYVALGNCASLVARNAHRVMRWHHVTCDCVADDGASLAYELACGTEASHVVSMRSVGARTAPCRLHSGRLCDVIGQEPHVMYLTTKILREVSAVRTRTGTPTATALHR